MPIENYNAYAAPCVGDISGKWNGDDGATYWIKQTLLPQQQNQVIVMWFGTSSLQEGTGFSNVFHGVRTGDTITGEWADIPMGKIMQQGKIGFVCVQEGGIDKLKRTSQTGGFGGAEFSKVNHIPVKLSNMQFGDCQMRQISLTVFPGGKAQWRAHAFSEVTGDAWVVHSLVLLDKSSPPKVLHTFPKFSSGTLPQLAYPTHLYQDDFHVFPSFKADLVYPAHLFNSIGSAHVIRATC